LFVYKKNFIINLFYIIEKKKKKKKKIYIYIYIHTYK